jgi:hypothetical protein
MARSKPTSEHEYPTVAWERQYLLFNTTNRMQDDMDRMASAMMGREVDIKQTLIAVTRYDSADIGWTTHPMPLLRMKRLMIPTCRVAMGLSFAETLTQLSFISADAGVPLEAPVTVELSLEGARIELLMRGLSAYRKKLMRAFTDMQGRLETYGIVMPIHCAGNDALSFQLHLFTGLWGVYSPASHRFIGICNDYLRESGAFNDTPGRQFISITPAQFKGFSDDPTSLNPLRPEGQPSSPRYVVVDERGIKFWVNDTHSDRRLRPEYEDEGEAQREADRLNHLDSLA